MLHAMLILNLLIIGCIQAIPASGPRKGEVAVKSPDGRYSGYLKKEPTNSWQEIVLQVTGCEMEVPINHVSDQVAEASIVLYYVRLPNYPDGRHAAQVIVKRKTRERLQEDVNRTKEISAESSWDEEDKRFDEWLNIQHHSELETYDRAILVNYRRDVECHNGDVMRISGSVHRVAERETGKSLFPEMDSVVRRIINSIRPLNVTTNN
jgi:hypothetical protein